MFDQIETHENHENHENKDNKELKKLNLASENGDLEYIKSYVEGFEGKDINLLKLKEVFNNAYSNNHHHILKYLFEKEYQIPYNIAKQLFIDSARNN